MKMCRLTTAFNLLLIMLIVASFAYFISYKSRSERNLAEIELKYWEISSLQNETMYRNALLREAYQKQLIVQDIELPKPICDSITSSTFILRLTETFCMSCHEKSIQLINEYFSKKDAPGLIVLGSFTSNHSFKNELSYLKAAKENLNIPGLNLSPIDSISTPYIFSIDSSGRIKRFCFLIKGEEDTLDGFLNMVAARKYD